MCSINDVRFLTKKDLKQLLYKLVEEGLKISIKSHILDAHKVRHVLSKIKSTKSIKAQHLVCDVHRSKAH